MTNRPENTDKQNNFCGECGCSCTCDGGCNGNLKNCTSKKAISKNCNHCCACYIISIAKKIRLKRFQ